MEKLLKGYLSGVLSAVILLGGVTYASNTIRIVVDNRELIPSVTGFELSLPDN